MPKIFIETNFSFPKLARKFKSIEKKSRIDLYKKEAKSAKGLHMMEYGRMHNNGEGRNTQRRFVNKFDKKAQERYTEALIEEIHKALKK